MNHTIQLRSYFIIFGIPLFLIVVIVALSQTTYFIENVKDLSWVITLDLIFTVPLIYYFLIRKKSISKFSVVTFFIVGLIIANIILPKEHHDTLIIIENFILPVVELTVISLLVLKARKIVLEYRKKKDESVDFFTAISAACNEIFPGRLSSFAATEIAMFYYLFFDWKKRRLKDNEFTVYKENGLISILFGIVLVLVIETVGLHMLLVGWNTVVAWILTVISIYTTLQLLSLIKSLSKRPVIVDGDNRKLILRYGFFAEAIISLDFLKSIEITSKDLPDDKSVIPFSPLGHIESHNCILHLKEENSFQSLYGIKKKYSSLALSIDDKNRFKNLFDKAILSKEIILK